MLGLLADPQQTCRFWFGARCACAPRKPLRCQGNSLRVLRGRNKKRLSRLAGWIWPGCCITAHFGHSHASGCLAGCLVTCERLKMARVCSSKQTGGANIEQASGRDEQLRESSIGFVSAEERFPALRFNGAKSTTITSSSSSSSPKAN